jgi:hypothetical protein
MQITTPIPGLDNFMVVDTPAGTKKVIFEQSSKFEHVARPGAQHKVLGALNLDFVVRAKSPAGAVSLMHTVWGEDDITADEEE